MSAHKNKNQVFLNFRGPDTRKGFTDFLNNSLRNAGVCVYRDNDALPHGARITPELLRAIRSCVIAIPIISKQYASSRHCLDELAEIMDCHRNYEMSVFPVFYGIDVLDARFQRRTFRVAFEKHKKRHNREEIEKWREALKSVTSIRGWIKTRALGDQQLIQMVVEKVSRKLQVPWIERLGLFRRRESKCQVFLAFRCRDTGSDFARQLFTRLRTAGIRVFDNDSPSLIGKDVTYEIRTAIDQCKICIPILSGRFASSRWCLGELAQMIDCNTTTRKKIIPIFYKVRPADVRRLSHHFREDMARHRTVTRASTYEQWKKALKEVGAFKGWELKSSGNGGENSLVGDVVAEASRSLRDLQSTWSPHPIRFSCFRTHF